MRTLAALVMLLASAVPARAEESTDQEYIWVSTDSEGNPFPFIVGSELTLSMRPMPPMRFGGVICRTPQQEFVITIPPPPGELRGFEFRACGKDRLDALTRISATVRTRKEWAESQKILCKGHPDYCEWRSP